MQKAYTVAQINRYIKNMFSHDYLLGSVSVSGEISNCTYHSSGHIYFTLKDKQSVLACVMFAGNRAGGLSFALQEGMQVVVSGNIDTYERDGKYQLYAKSIKQDGLGELYERFEKLKQELSAKGMFDKATKKPIPHFVRRLGVVTAPTGAAIRDIISIAKSRNPYIEIILYPAIVQGAAAASSVVQGIQMLEAVGVDAMIVGRGGGSIEDLWAFNEEIVAQAIYDCLVPIISAVGHETDTTIADYVADVRAETPSAAAQIAVCEIENILQDIDGMKESLCCLMRLSLERYSNKLNMFRLRLDRSSLPNQISDKRYHIVKLEDELSRLMLAMIDDRKHRLQLLAGRLDGVSPLTKLSQGYSYISDIDGNNIKSIKQLDIGDRFEAFVLDGRIIATVDEISSI